ncbi:OLC1v1010866C1 [Oldenlandia corymbosa var. corymbosa]|nr:OLC1v1010866C1 [Oldenlandia corymbosa var. corymbosa]
MCTELINLVNKVSKILQETEAAQPRCSNGIKSLCLLNNAICKAKLLIQYCSESSKLYLALTGDTILARCRKSKNLLEQSLSQLQHMVPVMLAAEISRTIIDLRGVVLRLEPSEQDAGEVLRQLLQIYKSPTNSSDETAFKALQVALSRLQIISQKDLLIEKRSIKKQLDKVAESDPMKKKILLFLHHLLKKYGTLALKEQRENNALHHEESFQLSSSDALSVEHSSRLRGRTDDAQVNTWHAPVIPEEFKCPLSSRLMYDPVVIDSGITFERLWIQKWFDENHVVCPKTKKKLDHFLLTPNMTMKDLIAEWCARTGVTLTDPSALADLQPLDSSFSSIRSLSSSVNDLSLPTDFNFSVRSSDDGLGSEYHETLIDGSNFSMNSEDSLKVEYKHRTNEINMGILVELDALSWECKCKVIIDIMNLLKHDHQTSRLASSETVIQPLLKFLKDAYDLHDVEALRNGCLLFSAFVEMCRISIIPCLGEEAYQLLVSFLDTEVAEETLAILVLLSSYPSCHKEIAASGTLKHLLTMLDTETSNLKEPALRILCNLSERSEVKSLIISSDVIPKLIAQFEDTALARHCVVILKNLCDYEDARAVVAECDGCIASIIKLLESDNEDDQEQAVAILLSLCSQRNQFCQLVMEEGVIPSLVAISVNGNDKGKAKSLELLRILRDEVRHSAGNSEPEPIASTDPSPPSKGKKSTFKMAGLFGKLPRFSKR